MKTARMLAAVLLMTIVIPVAGCSGSDASGSGGGSDADLAGHWTGRWQNSSPNSATGTFTLDWSEKGSDLSGIINIDNTPCLSSGSVIGSLDGDQITFGVVSGETTVDYTGAVNEDGSMSGTYSTTCGNARGAWQAARQ